MQVQMIQHAVGQGGLSSGFLSMEDDPKQLRWIYDCGSNQLDSLRREIRSLEPRPVDYLFISHLDADHIVGLEDLLAHCGGADEVVLPYLSDAIKLALWTQSLRDGRFTRTFLEVTADFPQWLHQRGVRRVTFVGGDNDDPDRLDLPANDRPLRPEDDNGSVWAKWSNIPVRAREQKRNSPSRQVQRVSSGSLLTAMSGTWQPVGWVLAPFAHPAPPARLRKFIEAVENVFGTRDIYRISRHLTGKAGRERLRSCYDALWTNHNLVSMALYAGPPSDIMFGMTLDRQRDVRSYRTPAVGWLLTGDAQLVTPKRKDAFLCAFAPYLKYVSAFMLPHHGSHRNFESTLLDDMDNLKVGFAAAGKNSYGHPSPAVRRSLGPLFHQVSSDPKSRLISTLHL